jgi:hypothetical protein
MFASIGFLLWFVPSMFVPQIVGIIVALVGISVSVSALILGSQRDDGKKRETMMLGGFMVVLWFFLLVFSFTANGF